MCVGEYWRIRYQAADADARPALLLRYTVDLHSGSSSGTTAISGVTVHVARRSRSIYSIAPDLLISPYLYAISSYGLRGSRA